MGDAAHATEACPSTAYEAVARTRAALVNQVHRSAESVKPFIDGVASRV